MEFLILCIVFSGWLVFMVGGFPLPNDQLKRGPHCYEYNSTVRTHPRWLKCAKHGSHVPKCGCEGCPAPKVGDFKAIQEWELHR